MKQTVWISKYALAAGIKEHQAEINEGKAYPGAPYSDYVGFEIGTEAHLSRDEAVNMAKAMAKKKIASLKKQIQKLESTQFD